MKSIKTALAFLPLALATSLSFGAPTSFVCTFPAVATPAGLKKEAKPFELRFMADSDTEKTYILGNNGANEVMPIKNKDSGTSYIEITGSGNVMVTAITASGEAVHSRNTILSSGLVPSQYYGKCVRH